MKQVVGVLIDFFAILLNPFGRTVCRYEPSCSRYAKECFDQHGVLKAAGLTLKRLFRCRPFGGAGYDPADNPK